MKAHEIRNTTGNVIYETEAESFKAALEQGARDDVSFNYADLTNADLAGADLTGAKLRGADLPAAKLAGADLTGADLTDAALAGADLAGCGAGLVTGG